MSAWVYEGEIIDGLGARITVVIKNPTNGKCCTVKAQIDSGASGTTVTRQRLESLDISSLSHQKIKIFRCGHEDYVDAFDVQIAIQNPRGQCEAFQLQVTDSLQPTNGDDLEALLGQDVLRCFQFYYDGKAKKFTLTRV